MWHDLVSAKYIEGYKLKLVFDDGKEGIVDFSQYLNKGGVFAKFEDINFFKSFKINEELGVITWDEDIDIAPETLYSLATGTKLPKWMQVG